MDTLICIWDLQQAVPQTVIYRPDEPVRALSFSADQALLAYCQEEVVGQPSSVDIMDTKSGGRETDLCVVQQHSMAARKLTCCSSKVWLVHVRSLHVIHVQSASCILVVPQPVLNTMGVRQCSTHQS